MGFPLIPARRSLAAVVGVAVAAGAIALAPVAAQADPANPTPVSAAALPTAQVNGVVWSQVVSGGVVYVGGSFNQSQPAGAAPGVDVASRLNLFAYDVASGVALPGFGARANAQVRSVAASPDGSRIYIGGDFTTVNGQPRNHLAAIDRSGNLVADFAPNVNGNVYSVIARGDSVYFGGSFSAVGGQTRAKAGAVTAAGAALPYAPNVADGTVKAISMSPDGVTVLLGGSFSSVNGGPYFGLAATDSTSGGSKPWGANSLITNRGSNAAIYHLSTRGDAVYAVGYVFSGNAGDGNLEGAVAMNWSDGSVRWLEDCHGDSYASAPFNDGLYVVSHAHDCSTVVGGWTNHDAPPTEWHRAQVFSQAATGTLGHWGGGFYADFGGLPSPTLSTAWRPEINTGTYTGTDQGAWSVAGGDSFLVIGGEFTAVNGARQTGLVRFKGQPEAADAPVVSPPPADPIPDPTDPGNPTNPGDPGSPGDPGDNGSAPATAATAIHGLALGPNKVAVRWTAAAKSDSATASYTVKASKAGKTVATAKVSAKHTRAVLQHLKKSTSYRVVVVATNKAGKTKASKTIVVKTKRSGANVSSVKLPSRTSKPRASATGTHSIRLTWNAASVRGATSVTHYQVRVYHGTKLVKTVVTSGSKRALAVTGLTKGWRYELSVRAENWAGYGPTSPRGAARTGR